MNYLCKNVVHWLARFEVVFAQHPQQAYEADLQERITNARHVMIGTVSRQNKILQDPHQIGHQLHSFIILKNQTKLAQFESIK